MSQAETMLNNLSDDEIAVLMAGSNEEEHIVIGGDRFITVPASLRRIAVQGDKDVETVTFDCPRYWDGLDISQWKIYVNYMRSDGYPDSYPVKNTCVDQANPDTIHFDWTIDRGVTEIKGSLSFLVCAREVDYDGNLLRDWNSELNTEMYVSQGLEVQETILRQYPDLVTQILIVADRANNIAAALEEHLANGDFTLGLPIVTEADNGRILRVANGVWTADQLEIYEGEALDELVVIDGAIDSSIVDGVIHVKAV